MDSGSVEVCKDLLYAIYRMAGKFRDSLSYQVMMANTY